MPPTTKEVMMLTLKYYLIALILPSPILLPIKKLVEKLKAKGMILRSMYKLRRMV